MISSESNQSDQYLTRDPYQQWLGGPGPDPELLVHGVPGVLKTEHICGGAVITIKWIVTAAHCTTEAIHDYTVRAGTSFIEHSGSLYHVTNIIRHPELHRNEHGVLVNDLALLQVREPFKFDSYRSQIMPNEWPLSILDEKGAI